MGQLNLPEKIKVKIGKCSHNKYIVELPEYDVHTEGEDGENLSQLVNDLIYTVFEVPKHLQGQIFYKQEKENDKDFEKTKPFILLSTPGVFRKYYC